jgi:predicted enzyme related to lactoylglutathione lyase
MQVQPIAAIMIHVPSVEEALDWYQQLFSNAARQRLEEEDFEYLTIEGIPLEFVLADEKVASGPCGSVVYWRVPELNSALAHAQIIGARLYRGPLQIENDVAICQIRDPWGTCIGLRGQVSAPV